MSIGAVNYFLGLAIVFGTMGGIVGGVYTLAHLYQIDKLECSIRCDDGIHQWCGEPVSGGLADEWRICRAKEK